MNRYKRFKATSRQSSQIGGSLRYIELKTTWKKDTSSKLVGYFRDGHQRQDGRKGRAEFLMKSYYFPNMTAVEIDGTRRQKYEPYW